MGNFYTNIVVRGAGADAAAAVLESHDRRAYVVAIDGSAFVYDERCDAQDLDELQRVAEVLSRECKAPALAACNHDDDVLWLALAESGGILGIYNSCPGYFDGGSEQPEIPDVQRLCDAFGVPGASPEVDAILRAPHSEVGFEFERHQSLLDRLKINRDAGIFGYSYVSRGELRGAVPSATVLSVGGAPAIEDAEDEAPRSTTPSAELPPGMAEIKTAIAGLVLSEVDAPAGFEKLIGSGKVSGFIAYFRLQQYITGNRLLDLTAPSGPLVRGDDRVAAFLGEREFHLASLARRLGARLDIWASFSAEDRRKIEAGDPEIDKRVADATARCMTQIAKELRG